MGGREGKKGFLGFKKKKRIRYWKGGKSVLIEDGGGEHFQAGCSVAFAEQRIHSKNEKR